MNTIESPSSSKAAMMGLGHSSLTTSLVFKPLKVPPTLPPDFQAKTWELLETSTIKILSTNFISSSNSNNPLIYSQEHLYKSVENLCINRFAEPTYKKLEMLLEKNMRLNVLGKLKDFVRECAEDLDAFIGNVLEVWSNICRQMLVIRNIFLYLDRTYVLQTVGLKSIWELGIDLFREIIIFGGGNGGDDGGIKLKLGMGILRQIECERNGELINRSNLKQIIRIYTEISIYTTQFEPLYLNSTLEFYRNLFVIDITNGESCQYYLKTVNERIKEETERCSGGASSTAGREGYLDEISRKGSVSIVMGCLVKDKVDDILKGFEDLMNSDSAEYVKTMYQLLSGVGCISNLNIKFGQYIMKYGLEIINDPNSEELINHLLKFKKRLDNHLKSSFLSDTTFQSTLKKNFENFMNHTPSNPTINISPHRPAELIAKKADVILRSKKEDEKEVEEVLEEVLCLFRFINGKDVFEAFYKKDLAKRLLLETSSSVDSEKKMLMKLREECGPGFTSRLEGMFKDIGISREIMNSLKSNAKFQEKIGKIDLYVNVLTHGFWPTYEIQKCILPDQFIQCQNAFKDFYMTRNQGRILTWQNNLGHCILKYSFDCGPKELIVSLFQTLVLLVFNEETSPTIEELLIKTGLPEKELQLVVTSLCIKTQRILIKQSRNVKVSGSGGGVVGDVYRINEGYKNERHRVRINMIQMKETKEETKKTNDEVFLDRNHSVDAAIVRIMKGKKTFGHTQLAAEVFEQLKFPIKAADFKKRVELLIEREYLERDTNDATLYRYLA